MTKTLLSVVTIIFLAAPVLLVPQSFAQQEQEQEKADKATKHQVVSAGEIKWVDAGQLLPKGAKIAIIEGDLTDEEISVVRLKFPGDYAVPAHTHPNVERVTVLSGVLHFGTGEKLDKEKTTQLNAGSFFKVDANHPHFVWTPEGQETELEIVTDGVFGIEYVNPDDDPRRAIGGGPEEGEEEGVEEPQKSDE